MTILTCTHCKTDFQRTLQQDYHRIKNNEQPFCSQKCFNLNRRKRITLKCYLCEKEIIRTPHEIQERNFCSHSCSAKYSNAHKTKGYKRAKLEVWLESQLKTLYPNITILFNDVNTLGLELDIYLPELKLAFELNGIFHYEPIYGDERLSKIQTNDNRKFQKCINLGISLCIIDTSKQKYFKESTSKQFLDIIKNIINKAAIERIELSPQP